MSRCCLQLQNPRDTMDEGELSTSMLMASDKRTDEVVKVARRVWGWRK